MNIRTRAKRACLLLLVLMVGTGIAGDVRGQEAMRVNYVNADLRDVVHSLAGLLGVNVLITEAVPDRRVTYTTASPVAVGDLGQVLEAILESEGLVLIQHGPVAEVVPAEQAPATGPLLYGKEMEGPPPLGLVSQFVPLQHVGAGEVQSVLLQIAGPTARIEVVPRSNALLITDRGTHIARYLAVLRQLDVPSQGEGGLQTYVYRLKHARAEELAVTLGLLYGVQVPVEAARPRDMLLDQSLTGALRQFRQRELSSLEMRRAAGFAGGAQEAPAAADSTPGQGGELVGRTLIVPDLATNALVIRTVPPNYPVLRETIDQLDVRPAQVLLEVHIAEIALDRSTAFGINWSAIQQRGNRTISGGVGPQVLADSAAGGVDELIVRVTHLNDVDVRGMLRALASDVNVRVLSTPHILALNNQAARILVGSEVPFNQSTRSGLNVVVDRIVQYRNVGTELNIIPTINEDGYVRFRILQQVSQLTDVTLESALGAPVIQTREAETSALVADGQTIVIGGLIGESTDRVRNGIPLLKDIPLLGYLFGSTSIRRVRTELAIFVTPHVVRTDEDAAKLLEEQRQRTPGVPPDPPPS
ncbi:MAG: secretin N-terminal domain-containing protein [Gemmatimonadota bacterium]